jgi:hypothetical protein
MSNGQFQPGQSGNPHGYTGPRGKARREILEKIHGLGHSDVLETLSTIQNDPDTDPSIRVAAASSLAPYMHPKLQSTPTPRFIEIQIDVPEFTNVSVAEEFLARILSLVAKGHLDIQQGQELAALAKMYIDSQYARDELQYKLTHDENRDQLITVQGGLPRLPGTDIAEDPNGMYAKEPRLANGHVADARALAAPKDVIQQEQEKEFPTPGQLKAVGEHPLQEHHFKPDPEPGKNSTNGGGEPCA